jgi:hypothetical protein
MSDIFEGLDAEIEESSPETDVFAGLDAEVEEPTRDFASEGSSEVPMSAAEAALSGFGRGASFGFSDELGGLVGAASEYLGGDPSAVSEEDILANLTPEAQQRVIEQGIDATPAETPKESFSDLLDEYTEVQRRSQEKALEDQPVANIAGMIGGGLAIPVGAGATAGKMTLGQMAGTGAGLGALAGAGESEGGLENRLEGAATGAIVGGLTGAALPAAGGIARQAGKVGQKIAKTDAGKLFTSARQGEVLSELVDPNLVKLKDVGGDISSELLERSGQESQKVRKALEEASDAGAAIDVRNLEAEVMAELDPLEGTPAYKKILKEFDNFKNKKVEEIRVRAQAAGVDVPEDAVLQEGIGEVRADEVYDLMKRIKKVASPAGSKDSTERAIFGEVDSILKNKLEPFNEGVRESYEKMSDLLGKYERFTGKSPSKFMSEKDAANAREKMQTLLLEADPKKAQGKTGLADILEGFTDPKGKKDFKGLEDIAPDLAETVRSEAGDLAEKIRLGAKAAGEKEIKTVSLDPVRQAAAQAGGGSSVIARGAEIAGSGARKVDQFVDRAVRGAGDRIVSVTPQNIRQTASKLSETGNQKYADLLSKLEGKGDAAKKAGIFSLMQTPGFRKAIAETEEE